MARTVIDLDDDALEEAREIFGTRSKVDTVNRALRDVIRLHRLAGQLDQVDNPFADAPVGDQAWA